MAAVTSIVLGFVLTTLVGGWWASRLQQRAWDRQNCLRLEEEDARRASEVCDELTRLLDRRVYRMRRLYWAVESFDGTDASHAVLQSSLDDYREVLFEWNDRLNANLARVATNFGSAAHDDLADLYESVRRVGSNLQKLVDSARGGNDVSDDLPAIDVEFSGSKQGSLNSRVYNLGLDMTTQLRDGRVGRNAPGMEMSPEA